MKCEKHIKITTRNDKEENTHLLVILCLMLFIISKLHFQVFNKIIIRSEFCFKKINKMSNNRLKSKEIKEVIIIITDAT